MFDYYYLVLVLPAVLFALICQAAVNGAFSKYSKVPSAAGITGRDMAAMVLSANGVTGVGIERVAGNLTDHYDPRTNVIRLSEGVYDSTSVAAVGVAAHEAGHAVQHAASYAPLTVRNAIIPITQIGSTLSMPLVLAGLIFSWYPIAMAGVILFGLAVLFQLVTLPVEFNASGRAIQAMQSSGYFSEPEIQKTSKVLRAAAMTYVAARAVALANFLRLFLLVNRRNNR